MLDRRAQLAQADRQVAEAKTRIRKQEQIVAALTAKDHDTRAAISFLAALTGALRAFEHHRRLISERLSR